MSTETTLKLILYIAPKRDPKKLLVEIGLSNTFNSHQRLAIYFDEAILKYIVLKVFRAVRRSLKLISMNIISLKNLFFPGKLKNW